MNEEEIKIGKKSWIPLETLVSAIVIACALTAIVIRGEIRGNQNAEDLTALRKSHATELHEMKMQQSNDINDLRVEIRAYVKSTDRQLDTISNTLTDLLSQRLRESDRAEVLAQVTMRDRWSLGCMSDHDKWWLKELQELFAVISEAIGVEITFHADRLPPLRQIQKNNGF